MIKIITWLLGLLPNSWFAQAEISAQISEYMSYINFFIPFNTALNLTSAWLACILAYFAFSWGLNLVNAIRDLL